ncbi:hypothetical protein NRK67_04950 [Fusobacteria bacterium ZRK30]|nr:hypothetical protein NRK67_04950 [Fusobacteria bacterium ZRK30]
MKEKQKILKMIEDGKITAMEGLKLLEQIEETDQNEPLTVDKILDVNEVVVTDNTSSKNENSNFKDEKAKFLRVKVDETNGDKVNIKIPLFLLKFGSKFLKNKVESCSNEAKNIDFDMILKQIDDGFKGLIVEINTDKELVQLIIE